MNTTAEGAAALDAILQHRRSCRGFKPDPVPAPILDRMVRMAQQSPSWCNVQPWHLYITCGQGTESLRQGFAQHLHDLPTPDLAWPPGYQGVYQERRRACARALYDSVGVAWGDREASRAQTEKNFSFFGAPHVAILTAPASLGVYGAIDVGVYLGNLLLVMDSLGLGAIAQAALAIHGAWLHDHLSIPADRHIVCGVSFGYADESDPANGFRTARANVDEVVHFVDA